ncbi:MAG: LptF/LptG family permease [Bacteroidales bacterium]
MVEKIKEKLGWKLLDSYILKKFLGSVVYSIALLMTIIVVFDVSENLQRFMDKNAPLNEIIFQYYFNFVPYFINLFLPLFTFISVIWFTSKLSSNNEIIAILNGGVNFYRFIVPYIVGGLIIAFVSLILANFIVPQTNQKLNDFKGEYFKHKVFSTTNIHIKNSATSYLYVERWERENKTGYQFSYEAIGDSSIVYKLKAISLQYNEEARNWTLHNYVKRYIADGVEHIESGEHMDTVFNVLPTDFNQDINISETMSYSKLRNFIKEEEEKGSSLVKHYQIEKNKRIANPFGTLIMTLLGLSVASRKTRRGVGVHLFIGMGLAFSFIFFQQVSTVFSISGNLPPVIGTWIPNIIFLIICIILLRYTQK